METCPGELRILHSNAGGLESCALATSRIPFLGVALRCGTSPRGPQRCGRGLPRTPAEFIRMAGASRASLASCAGMPLQAGWQGPRTIMYLPAAPWLCPGWSPDWSPWQSADGRCNPHPWRATGGQAGKKLSLSLCPSLCQRNIEPLSVLSHSVIVRIGLDQGCGVYGNITRWTCHHPGIPGDLSQLCGTIVQP